MQDNSNNQALSFSSHRPWVRVGSLLALIDYIGQMACHVLIISGLSLVPLSSLKAMEQENPAQYFHSNPNYYYIDEDTESRGIPPRRPTDSFSLQSHQIKPAGMIPSLSSSSLVPEETLEPPVAAPSGQGSPQSTSFYKDSDHLLTHEFWKDKDLSDRLKRIKTDIEELKKKIINHKTNSIEINEFLEKYKKLLKCSECEADFTLIGCDLHFMSENDMPKDLGPDHTPAIIQLEDHTYDLEDHTYDLLVNTSSGDIKRIPAPEEMDLNTLNAFFQKYPPQSKQFLAWNDPLMQYLTSKGGHHPFIPVHQGQTANFSLRHIKGGSGCDLAILSRDGVNFIAIKNFNDIEEGMSELLYSLVALDINPAPQELKMARVYDAIIYPENCLNLIMEGANTHVIHYYLSTDLAESVVKACANYFAQFHLKNNNNKNIDGGRYIHHVARAAKTLKGNPLKGENQEKPALYLLKGKQWTENNLKDLQSSNIIRSLSEQEQENFAHLVKRICDKFESNCNKIFRSLNSEDREEQELYFLTLTHGDAHGNNFFYNNDEKINGYEISKDSFKRVTMIDVGKVARTYGQIGDPAEDIGRFVGSLWDWYFLQNFTESQELKYYGKIEFLENQFVKTYLQNICSHISTEEKQERFEEIFKENCSFYKLRFYRAIFNFTKNKDEKKDKEIKKRVLKSWMNEKANVKLLSQNLSHPIVLKKESKDRLWIPVAGKVISRLPDRPIGFVESAAESADKSYLTLVWEDLHHTGTATLSSQAAIAGMGGIGKTSSALEYAYEALENNAYDLVYWLLSETEISLMKGYRDLLIDMGVLLNDEADERIVELIKEYIPRQGKCLLIYDNVPTPDFLKDKTPTGAHILITSRYRHGWGKPPINLEVFRSEDSVKYLLNTIGLDETTPDNQKKAKELARELEHFPLALSHAAHYIKLSKGNSVFGDPLARYLQELKKESTVHFEEHQNPFREDELEMTYENLIGKTLRMARKQISNSAQELLVYCSYLDPTSIVEDIFLGSMEKEALDLAFKELCSFSLIKSSQQSYSIHRLVQLVIRQEQETAFSHQLLKKSTLHDQKFLEGMESQGQQVVEEVCKLFLKKAEGLFKTDSNNSELREITSKYLPHVLTLLKHSKRLNITSQKSDYLELAGKILYFIGANSMLSVVLTVDSENEKVKERIQRVLEQGRVSFEDLRKQSNLEALEWLLKIAKQSNSSVQYAIGVCYYYGHWVPLSHKRALKWLTRAAEQGNLDALSILGYICATGEGAAKDEDKAIRLYTKAAEQGNASAQSNLGLMYMNGQGVDKDDTKAAYWLAKAAKQGNAFAQTNLGAMYGKGQGVKQDDTKAIEWYTKAAQQENAGAQYNLGVSYLSGQGIEQNYGNAFYWLTKAAEQGIADAQYTLGLMYLKGQGIKQDDTRAKDLFIQAAEQGNADAQNNLGLMYANGRGTEQDYAKAIYWLGKAAQQRNVNAQFMLGLMYASGRGVEQDYTNAAYWLGEAAQQGDPDAQLRLGFMHLNGLGVDMNGEKAIDWLTRAGEQGNLEAQNSLSLMYLNGQGVKQDDTKAAYWFIAAAQQGDSDAQFRLGFMYLNGRGVGKDEDQAIVWFLKAVEQGNAYAQLNLGLMYANGQSVKRDYAEAINLYTMSAEQGNACAQFSLALMYEKGEGVEQNEARAIEIYNKAAQQGLESAQTHLAEMYLYAQREKQDYVKATYWFTKLAEQGNADAQYHLGQMDLNGWGITKNLEKAYKRFGKAVQTAMRSESKYDQVLLGNLYLNGWGTVQNYEEAFKWYKKVADQEGAEGQAQVGGMYKEGWGVLQDLQEALQWIQKAATQNDQTGQYYLALLYRDGEGIQSNDAYALDGLRNAAKQSVRADIRASAQYTLGWMYENGRGVDKDLEEASKWYKLAERGCPAHALYSLGRMYEYGLNVDLNLGTAIEWYKKAAELHYFPAKQKLS
ncbi:Sel1-like repeat-containing protein kinase family protein [Candidatus Odyssella thessalonicensis]|uniref:DUF7779 domain-containing protein n=1 Tax=Candidatus Odyssella thessalonicensis TaxID=84647 RepID=UPI000225A994|nr:Sel1-like repeat-containing protein kinase family protein [Candidatus Odyssella thessalonicensis]